ncbi:MAG: Ig-like domain-containing protein, partial [Limisphaerales bacterium]
MKNWLQSSRAAIVACAIGLLLNTSAARGATPTVAISSPNNNLRTTNANIIVTGTARSTDTNDPIASVTVFVNGISQTADGTTGWLANATLTSGDNVISAQSTTVGNVQSTTVIRHVTLQVFSTLT